MGINKIILLNILLLLFLGCKKDVSKKVSITSVNTIKVDTAKDLSKKEAKEKTSKSFVISCGSGCAMTYNVNEISSNFPIIKVKFKIDMYVNEKQTDTYNETYLFKYDNSKNIKEIQQEGENDNILNNLLPDAQESFKEFAFGLIHNNNNNNNSNESILYSCIKESLFKLPYKSTNSRNLKYNLLECNFIVGIGKYNCDSEKLRYISLPNKNNINLILVPQDCGDFPYRFLMLTIKENNVIDSLYVEGEWYEPEDSENIEYTSFKIDSNFNIEVITKINNNILKKIYTINSSGKIIGQKIN